MISEKVYHVPKSESAEQAEWLTDFSFPWLDRKSPGTKFRAWHGNDIFYFQFQAEDDDIVLDESEDDQDKVLGSDRVELFFSPSPNLSPAYYGFEMDPRGMVYAYRAEFHRKFDPSWSLPELDVCAGLDETGYKLKGSIPMEKLRELNCLRGNEMITGVFRGEFSHRGDGNVQQDWISWIDPKTESPDFHIPETFGLFVFED